MKTFRGYTEFFIGYSPRSRVFRELLLCTLAALIASLAAALYLVLPPPPLDRSRGERIHPRMPGQATVLGGDQQLAIKRIDSLGFDW